ncbi:hypothetical protein IW262DRAFT_1080375 [Armillaria fumosa]|nr:hypothetical protein IW262DRAFT_1080375 [Armillaria fumosa]
MLQDPCHLLIQLFSWVSLIRRQVATCMAHIPIVVVYIRRISRHMDSILAGYNLRPVRTSSDCNHFTFGGHLDFRSCSEEYPKTLQTWLRVLFAGSMSHNSLMF